jgi:hypothetical protein
MINSIPVVDSKAAARWPVAEALAVLATSSRPFQPAECAALASRAAALVDLGVLPRTQTGASFLLWQDEHSVGWLNLVPGRRLPRSRWLSRRHLRDRGKRHQRGPAGRRTAPRAPFRAWRLVLGPRYGYPPDGSPSRGGHGPRLLAATRRHWLLRGRRWPAPAHARAARRRLAREPAAAGSPHRVIGGPVMPFPSRRRQVTSRVKCAPPPTTATPTSVLMPGRRHCPRQNQGLSAERPGPTNQAMLVLRGRRR